MTNPTDSLNQLRPTEQAYLSLLKISLSDEWRALNQDVFARLRDEIAADWQWDSDRVQDHFEGLARNGFCSEISVIDPLIDNEARSVKNEQPIGMSPEDKQTLWQTHEALNDLIGNTNLRDGDSRLYEANKALKALEALTRKTSAPTPLVREREGL